MPAIAQARVSFVCVLARAEGVLTAHPASTVVVITSLSPAQFGMLLLLPSPRVCLPLSRLNVLHCLCLLYRLLSLLGVLLLLRHLLVRHLCLPRVQ